ncbi:hypothetical protein K503DRAFT_839941 [Rhizopogon vinicolor AM-OR11-026]|uniref:Methyltransferase domain-containing protein n=1 Tax=Rhizopogon vinicolor AM-OR11-026 TaxID=1314800 RepID=A0A1B7MKP7_9AGAM|nr:hypothetical protein K503DRAFT_839941 [Rhizopogon vinicolor AM-OR11-026]
MDTILSKKRHILECIATHKDSNILLGDVPLSIPVLDTNLYNLTPEEAAFFKTQIGIDDDEELKRHILDVQTKAYKVAPYPCIHGFTFLKLNISTYPVYQHILKLGRERPGAVLLDIGCCFGVDARKAAADGFPVENIIASDINNEFLTLSHELFRTAPSSYPGCFIPGDIFDPAFLRIAELSEDVSSAPATDLSSLESLNPLRGRISVINATRLFHLFNEDKQLHLARALAGLLSAQPGSVICGDQIGALEKGFTGNNLSGSQLFAHCPETWTSMWDGNVFEKGSVKVETDLLDRIVHGKQLYLLRWSVTRL